MDKNKECARELVPGSKNAIALGILHDPEVLNI